MPRGKRKSLEEQIAELTDWKKKLQEQKEKDDIKKLLDAASKAGMTPEALVKKLTEK